MHLYAQAHLAALVFRKLDAVVAQVDEALTQSEAVALHHMLAPESMEASVVNGEVCALV